MSSTRKTMLIFSVFAALVVPTQLTFAVEPENAPPAPSNINYDDLFFDFALYAGTPQFRWRVVWDLGNGQTQITAFFQSHEDAKQFAEDLIMYHLEPQGATGYEIEEVEVTPHWEHFYTFDKLADALLFAQALQNVGLYSDIQRVSIFSSRLSR